MLFRSTVSTRTAGGIKFLYNLYGGRGNRFHNNYRSLKERTTTALRYYTRRRIVSCALYLGTVGDEIQRLR